MLQRKDLEKKEDRHDWNHSCGHDGPRRESHTEGVVLGVFLN